MPDSQLARIGVLTVSDRASRGEYEDISGKAINDFLARAVRSNWVAVVRIVPDGTDSVAQALIEMVERDGSFTIPSRKDRSIDNRFEQVRFETYLPNPNHPSQADARHDLERFALRERGENRRQPAREHRLPRSGRTDQEHVVPARGRDLERALGGRLADDIGEVRFVAVRRGRWRGPWRRRELPRAKLLDQIPKRARRRQRHAAHQRGFGHVRGREHERAVIARSRKPRDRQRAAHAADRPVEPELPHQQQPLRRVNGKLAGRHEHA